MDPRLSRIDGPLARHPEYEIGDLAEASMEQSEYMANMRARRDAYYAANPSRDCYPLEVPGQLCTVCWTTHKEDAQNATDQV